mgnify:CR=1 FL=1
MIPMGFPDVTTRIRIIVSDVPIIDPCDSIYNGEIEDYNAMVTNSVDEDFVVVLTTRDSDIQYDETCDLFSFTVQHEMCNAAPATVRPFYLFCFLEQASSTGGPIATSTYAPTTPIQWVQSTTQVDVDISVLFPNQYPLDIGEEYILRVYQNRAHTDNDCTTLGLDGLEVHFIQGDECQTVLEYNGISWERIFARSGEENIDLDQSRSAIKQAVTIDHEFEVYPNPVKDQLQIDFQIQEKMPINLYLTDLTGKRVKAFYYSADMDAGAHAQSLELVDLPSGMYFLTLETAKQQVVKKIFVL